MEISKQESNIARFFDKEGKSMSNKQKSDGMPETAKLHIKNIIESRSEKALDVGSGNLLIDMLENGVDNVVGIDLSHGMIELANENLREKQLSERAIILQGSFLEIDDSTIEGDKKIDAISMHRVLCCHR